MDVTTATVPEIERYIIDNASNIRKLGNGKMTLKAIAESIGNLDKKATKILSAKVRRSKIFHFGGGSYRLKSGVPAVDDASIIDGDPLMRSMRDALGKIKIKQDVFSSGLDDGTD